MPSKKPLSTANGFLRGSGSTVLIVEDDGDVSQSLRTVIEDQGWRVLCASNGREALALLEDERPSLMLIDLFMPIMNGVELLRVVRRTAGLATIPRVIMTAANDPMIGVKEDVPVLYKPVDFDALSQLLQQYRNPVHAPGP